MDNKIIIGVTYCKKYDAYSRWIQSYGPGVEVVRLIHSDPEPERLLEKCQAIVLTGGEDVHPRLYNHPEYAAYCDATDMNDDRDAFEWTVLEHTVTHALPLLGICRGLQMANVFFGGSLIPDIPTWGKLNHSNLPDGKDRYHPLQVDPTSGLHALTGLDAGIVNSYHHQAADRIGKGLVASALSADGVVEALERMEPAGKPFLHLVQWHPERMNDLQHPFSKNILKAFAGAAIRNT
jgi:putative glutamine amidotransferase